MAFSLRTKAYSSARIRQYLFKSAPVVPQVSCHSRTHLFLMNCVVRIASSIAWYWRDVPLSLNSRMIISLRYHRTRGLSKMLRAASAAHRAVCDPIHPAPLGAGFLGGFYNLFQAGVAYVQVVDLVP